MTHTHYEPADIARNLYYQVYGAIDTYRVFPSVAQKLIEERPLLERTAHFLAERGLDVAGVAGADDFTLTLLTSDPRVVLDIRPRRYFQQDIREIDGFRASGTSFHLVPSQEAAANLSALIAEYYIRPGSSRIFSLPSREATTGR